MTEEALTARITCVNVKGETGTDELWQMLQHLVNHSTYHRGQITTMLRQLGAEPAATDFLVVGYPADDCVVPEIRKKSLLEIATFV
ncbi:MAG: hypothetical protein ONB46_15570 [candidate division KSB1 bacterium]|nr:hypothetical protein [candidate division KSB1 bacterium]MDZ7367135.1 hypothetical protein [candidate division KSB1 bacterium]MDZ7405113.1 hypothetical protein [candidate division KSB1 bacterium]